MYRIPRSIVVFVALLLAGCDFFISTEKNDPIAAPSIIPSGGTYASIQRVRIKADSTDFRVHYTLDGSTPTISSPEFPFDTEILVMSSTTIKAIAVLPNIGESDIVAADFDIARIKTIDARGLASFTTYRWPVAMAMDGDYVYISYNNGDEPHLETAEGGFIIVDKSDPDVPAITRVVHNTGSGSLSWGIAYYDSHIYLGNDVAGAYAYDVSDKSNPVLVGNYNTFAMGMTAYNDQLFVSVPDSSGGVLILDISDPTDLSQTAFVPTSGSSATPTFKDNFLYSGNASTQPEFQTTLIIYNATNITAPVLTGNYSTAYWVSRIIIIDNYAYLGANELGVEIIDISNKASPTQTKSISGIIGDVSIDIFDDTVFVAGTEGVFLYDISDPLAPRWVGFYEHSPCADIRADAEYIYLVGREGFFEVLSYN